MAEAFFGEEVEVSIRVRIREAVPLPDLEFAEDPRAPPVRDLARRAHSLEEEKLSRPLLNEEIRIAVRVDVGKLGPRHIESPEEGHLVGDPGRIQNLEGSHVADPGGGGGRGGGALALPSGFHPRGAADEEEEEEGQGKGGGPGRRRPAHEGRRHRALMPPGRPRSLSPPRPGSPP